MDKPIDELLKSGKHAKLMPPVVSAKTWAR